MLWRGDHAAHVDNVAAGLDEGLIPLYAAVSSEDDWDHYPDHEQGKRGRWAGEAMPAGHQLVMRPPGVKGKKRRKRSAVGGD